jgi:endonuclease/exonuclease/phosphatase family metal-dependent hydrolase
MHSWSNSEDCSSTIGNESLHYETNDNGMKMIQFATSKVLNVRSTFPHNDTQQETWYTADCRTANQIDHILISNRFRSAITDIRILRRSDIGSDHNL